MSIEAVQRLHASASLPPEVKEVLAMFAVPRLPDARAGPWLDPIVRRAGHTGVPAGHRLLTRAKDGYDGVGDVGVEPSRCQACASARSTSTLARWRR
jgi:hypothetical protein